MSASLGLVDFGVGLVDLILFFALVKMIFGLVYPGYSLPKVQAGKFNLFALCGHQKIQNIACLQSSNGHETSYQEYNVMT